MVILDKSSKEPVYKQLIRILEREIQENRLQVGSKLPSINKLAAEQKLAKETVIKAFSFLEEKGMIGAVHGKGYFVLSNTTDRKFRIFVLFDTFSAYKEVMYHALVKEAGTHSVLDIYFHHYNQKVFRQLTESALGNYDAYIVLPFDFPEIDAALSTLPLDKLVVIDRKPLQMTLKVRSVFQNFQTDIYRCLAQARPKLEKYQELRLILRNTSTIVPPEIKDGFLQFCREHSLTCTTSCEPLQSRNVKEKTAYIVIDDEDLVTLVSEAQARNLKIGSNLGILSYNDTPLKKVVANGISVISTDFARMGKKAFRLTKTASVTAYENPCGFIDRGSL